MGEGGQTGSQEKGNVSGGGMVFVFSVFPSLMHFPLMCTLLCPPGCTSSPWALGRVYSPCCPRHRADKSSPLLLFPLSWTPSPSTSLPSYPLLTPFIQHLAVKNSLWASLFLERPQLRPQPGDPWAMGKTPGKGAGEGMSCGSPERMGSLETSRGRDLFWIHKVRRAFEVISLFSFSFFLLSGEGTGSELSVRKINVAAIYKMNW